MIKKLLLLFFFAASCFAFAQVKKFTAVGLSSRNVQNGQWTEWKAFETVDILASLNLEANKIKIYSRETQEYDIISCDEKETDEDGDEYYRMFCEDKDGLNCHIDLYVLNGNDQRLQLYIRYNDFEFVYDLVPNN